MLMWIGLIASLASVPLMYGVGPQWGLWAALAALGVCFTTFCLLYDQPVQRARARLVRQMTGMSAQGVNSEDYHRLQSTAVKPTAEERKMVMSPMLLAHLLAAITGVALVVWGVVLRTT